MTVGDGHPVITGATIRRECLSLTIAYEWKIPFSAFTPNTHLIRIPSPNGRGEDRSEMEVGVRETPPIQIAILAPTLAVRVGLRTLLEVSEALRIVAETADPADLLDTEVDVLILQGQESLEGLAALCNAEAKPGLLWISDNPEAAQTLRGLPVSAWGLLSSEASSEELTAAVHAVHQGLIVAPRLKLEALWVENPLEEAEDLIEQLTPRETEILELLAQGLANKQIALELEISEHTVKFHVSSIYAKLGATNRMEAVRMGLQLGLITL
jgi:DNA-binding NarL/FixJ family response regulator